MRPALARRLLLMTLLLVSLTLFATTLGAMRLPLVNLLPSGDDMLRHIWLTIRLPRVLLALLVGAALALSGCVMQGCFATRLPTRACWASAAAPRWRWPAGWCSRSPLRG
ncbi:Hemin ABC transporter, permease protein [Klebsiella pneumoniae]|uniref:Hemin ABC transporter, permease protein n=2 Tax=Klebsiella pneumoniae TaxID=573 RepID=A0A447RPM1_KLEPN|nr:Hemin ABC transporter, permease protein [Klebsiella pneumoniae]